MLQALVKKHWRALSILLALKIEPLYIGIACLIGICFTHQLSISFLLFFFLYIKKPKHIILLVSIACCMSHYASMKWHSTKTLELTEPITVVVTDMTKQTPDQTTMIVTLDDHRLYVTTDADNHETLNVGDVVKLSGNLSKPTSPSVPHAFDFKTYLKSKSIEYTYRADTVEVVGHQWVLKSFQARALDFVHQTFEPIVASYLSALFLGEDTFLNEEVTASAADLGVLHLFAISGLHVTLLATMLLNVLKRCGRLNVYHDEILVVSLLLFVILTGGSPSVVRASSMMILTCLAQKFNWSLSRFDVLAIVFVVAVLLDPNQVRQLGFMYSYVLTFFLLGSSMTHPIMMPIYLMVATLPIQFGTQGIWNVLTFVANLICIPVMSQLVIPFLLLVLVCPPLQHLAKPLVLSFEWLLMKLQTYSVFNLTYGVVSASVCFLLACLLLMMMARYIKVKSITQFITQLSVVFGSLYVMQQVKVPMLTMLDVGQGDSFVIQSTSCDMLVDTGGQFSFTGESKSQFDYTLGPYLTGEGISTLDYVFLTHGDFDHVGEALPLFEQFNVKHLVVSAYGMSPLLEEVIDVAKQQGTSILTAKKDDVLTCGDIQMTFHHTGSPSLSINDNSLVMTVEMENVKTLLTGDISSEVEKVLDVGPTHVYKAGHHGAASSNDSSFMDALSPVMGVVSAGKNNRYGHPSSALVSYFEQQKLPLYNTIEDGSVELRMKSGQISVQTYPKK